MTTASSPPPSLPSPASDSGAVLTVTFPPPPKIETASNNGVAHDVFEEMPKLSHFKVLDRKDYIDKYQKYESEYTRMLMTKYFSSKNIYGGNIFEEKLTIGDETIMSSRWPGTQSFADPMQDFQEQNSNGSSSREKSPANISNGNLPLEKND